jgi:hypothetical protein
MAIVTVPTVLNSIKAEPKTTKTIKISLAFLPRLCQTRGRSSDISRRKSQTPRERGTESHGSLRSRILGKEDLKTAELPQAVASEPARSLGFCVYERGVEEKG